MLDYLISTFGSLTGVAIWFHFDLEHYWQLWKIRSGRRQVLRQVAGDQRDREIHAVAVDQFNREGFAT